MATKRTIVSIIITVVSIGMVFALYMVGFNFPLQQGKTILIHFDYVGSVNVGTPVRKSGIKIGVVQDMEIDPKDQRSVFVTVTLAPGHTTRVDDTWVIVPRGLLGDMNIEVYAGPITSPEVPDRYVFKGAPMFDMNRVLLEGGDILKSVNDSTQKINALIDLNAQNITVAITNIAAITEDLRSVSGNMRQFAQSIPRLEKSITESADQLSASIGTLSERANVLIATMDKELGLNSAQLLKTLASIDQAARHINVILEGFNKSDSLLRRLQEPQTATEVFAMLKNIAGISEQLLATSKAIRGGVDDFLGAPRSPASGTAAPTQAGQSTPRPAGTPASAPPRPPASPSATITPRPQPSASPAAR